MHSIGTSQNGLDQDGSTTLPHTHGQWKTSPNGMGQDRTSQIAYMYIFLIHATVEPAIAQGSSQTAYTYIFLIHATVEPAIAQGSSQTAYTQWNQPLVGIQPDCLHLYLPHTCNSGTSHCVGIQPDCLHLYLPHTCNSGPEWARTGPARQTAHTIFLAVFFYTVHCLEMHYVYWSPKTLNSLHKQVYCRN